MKKTFYFFTVVLIIICAGCSKSTEEKIVGTWKLKSMEGVILTANEFETTITLTDDGKFNSKTGSGEESSGTWLLSDDEKTIEATFAEGDKTTWHIVSIDDKQFIYTVDTDTQKITLEKQ
jgi:hypothetical protein